MIAPGEPPENRPAEAAAARRFAGPPPPPSTRRPRSIEKGERNQPQRIPMTIDEEKKIFSILSSSAVLGVLCG
jgi:hypothetical protein